MITHFFRFADESSAQAALLAIWGRTDMMDAGFQVTKPDGVSEGSNPTVVPGYHANVALPDLSAPLAALPEFIGALDWTGTVVAGTGPTWPKQIFAGQIITQQSPLLNIAGEGIATGADTPIEATL